MNTRNIAFNSFIMMMFVPGAAFAAPEGAAKVSQLQGKAEKFSAEGKTTLLKSGSTVDSNELVRTADNGSLKLVMTDGSEIDLGPSSQIKIEAAKKEEPSSLSVFYGQLRAKVTKAVGGDTKLTVKTSGSVMGVRGTDFQVVYNGQNAMTSLVTFDGSVAMTKTVGAVPLQLTPRAATALAKAAELLNSPALSGGKKPTPEQARMLTEVRAAASAAQAGRPIEISPRLAAAMAQVHDVIQSSIDPTKLAPAQREALAASDVVSKAAGAIVSSPPPRMSEVLSDLRDPGKSVEVGKGQFSGLGPAQTTPSLPVKISPAQLESMKASSSVGGVSGGGGGTPGASSVAANGKPVLSPIPPGMDAKLLVASSADAQNAIAKVVGVLPPAPALAAPISAPPPEGSFDAKSGKFAPPAGGFVDMKTGAYVPPPPGSAFDPIAKVYIPPATMGTFNASTGAYVPPTGFAMDAVRGLVAATPAGLPTPPAPPQSQQGASAAPAAGGVQGPGNAGAGGPGNVRGGGPPMGVDPIQALGGMPAGARVGADPAQVFGGTPGDMLGSANRAESPGSPSGNGPTPGGIAPTPGYGGALGIAGPPMGGAFGGMNPENFGGGMVAAPPPPGSGPAPTGGPGMMFAGPGGPMPGGSFGPGPGGAGPPGGGAGGPGGGYGGGPGVPFLGPGGIPQYPISNPTLCPPYCFPAPTAPPPQAPPPIPASTINFIIN